MSTRVGPHTVALNAREAALERANAALATQLDNGLQASTLSGPARTRVQDALSLAQRWATTSGDHAAAGELLGSVADLVVNDLGPGTPAAQPLETAQQAASLARENFVRRNSRVRRVAATAVRIARRDAALLAIRTASATCNPFGVPYLPGSSNGTWEDRSVTPPAPGTLADSWWVPPGTGTGPNVVAAMDLAETTQDLARLAAGLPPVSRDPAARTPTRAIRYRSGYIEFASYVYEQAHTDPVTGAVTLVTGRVKVPRMSGRSKRDYAAANRQMQIAIPGWSQPNGWTWHHHEDGETMELVPGDLNNLDAKHTGGASIVKDTGY